VVVTDSTLLSCCGAREGWKGDGPFSIRLLNISTSMGTLGWDLISLTKKSMVEVEPGMTLWFTETMTSFSLMPACTAGESGYGSEDTVTPGIKWDVN